METFPTTFGEFVLLKELGRGGSSAVFLAAALERPDLPIPIVVKRLFPHKAEHPELVRRFHHENKVARAVIGPRIARVFESGEHDGHFYIVMEYVPGQPLGTLMEDLAKRGEKAPLESSLTIMAGALEGLHAIHSARDENNRPLEIVHRDVSPKNILVRRDGEACLIDLGISNSVLKDWATHAGAIIGSVGYMSPEQARGQTLTPRSDLYSLGVVFFELLTLKNYVPRGEIASRLQFAAAPAFVPPSKFRPEVSPALDELLKKALASDPSDRFQTALEFRDAIAEIQAQAKATSTVNILTREQQEELDEASTEVTRLITRTVSFTQSTQTELRTQLLSKTTQVERKRSHAHVALLLLAVVSVVAPITYVWRTPSSERPAPRPEAPVEPMAAPQVKVSPSASDARVVSAAQSGPPPVESVMPALERSGTTRTRRPETIVKVIESETETPSLHVLVARAKAIRARRVSEGRDSRELDQLLAELTYGGSGDRLREWQNRLKALDR